VLAAVDRALLPGTNLGLGARSVNLCRPGWCRISPTGETPCCLSTSRTTDWVLPRGAQAFPTQGPPCWKDATGPRGITSVAADLCQQRPTRSHLPIHFRNCLQEAGCHDHRRYPAIERIRVAIATGSPARARASPPGARPPSSIAAIIGVTIVRAPGGGVLHSSSATDGCASLPIDQIGARPNLKSAPSHLAPRANRSRPLAQAYRTRPYTAACVRRPNDNSSSSRFMSDLIASACPSQKAGSTEPHANPRRACAMSEPLAGAVSAGPTGEAVDPASPPARRSPIRRGLPLQFDRRRCRGAIREFVIEGKAP